MSRIALLALLAGVTVSIAACSDSLSQLKDDAADEVAILPKTEIIAYGRPDNLTAHGPDGNPEDLRRELAGLRSSLLSLIGAEEPLATRDARVRGLLMRNRSFSRSHYLEQFAAVRMLRQILATEQGGPIDAVDYYTTLLFENGSPETLLIRDALLRLDGHWTPEQIRETAEATAKRGVAWLDKVCAECTGSKLGDLPSDTDAVALLRKRTEITLAAEDLRHMASP